jgi:hypothetical protein
VNPQPIPRDSRLFLDLLLARLSPDERKVTNLTLTVMRANKQPLKSQFALVAKSRHLFPDNSNALDLALTAAFAANQKGFGVFVSIALCRPGLSPLKRGGRTDLKLVPALWCDLDNRPPNAAIVEQASTLIVPPSLTVSSGAGSHLYWILTQASDAIHTADSLLRAIAIRLNGCHFSSAQPMRLPGTQNTKEGRHNAVCTITEYHPDYLYPITDFGKLLPPPPQPSLSSTPSLRPQRTSQSAYDPLNPALLNLVENVLLSHYDGILKTNGWIAARCPYPHTYDHAGRHFNYHPQLGIGRCYGKHGRVYLKDLCAQLGISLSPYGGTIYLKQ